MGTKFKINKLHGILHNTSVCLLQEQLVGAHELSRCCYVSIIIMYITMHLHILSKEVLNFYSATYDYSFDKVKVWLSDLEHEKLSLCLTAWYPLWLDPWQLNLEVFELSYWVAKWLSSSVAWHTICQVAGSSPSLSHCHFPLLSFLSLFLTFLNEFDQVKVWRSGLDPAC